MTSKKKVYRVQHDVTIPARNARYKKYPYERMAVGDCFDLEDTEDTTRNRALCAARAYRDDHVPETGPKFRIITRLVTTGRTRVVRVWRVA